MIEEIEDKQTKRNISRLILEALQDMFEIQEAREQYILESSELIMVANMHEGQPQGFLCLRETGKDTVEIAVMGVLKEFQRKGIGRRLFEAAKALAAKRGYSFIQVKTVQMGRYVDYDKTNLFYLSLGFKEFEVIPALWDENNPCQIYVMAL